MSSNDDGRWLLAMGFEAGNFSFYISPKFERDCICYSVLEQTWMLNHREIASIFLDDTCRAAFHEALAHQITSHITSTQPPISWLKTQLKVNTGFDGHPLNSRDLEPGCSSKQDARRCVRDRVHASEQGQTLWGYVKSIFGR